MNLAEPIEANRASVPRPANQKTGEFAFGIFGSPNRTRTYNLLVNTRSGTVHNTSPAERDRRRKPSLRPLWP